jgi:hypothetical protein
MPEMTSPDEEIIKIEPQEMIWRLVLLLLTISVAALSSALKWKPRVPGFLEGIVHEEQVVYYIAALLLLMLLTTIQVWRNGESGAGTCGVRRSLNARPSG